MSTDEHAALFFLLILRNVTPVIETRHGPPTFRPPGFLASPLGLSIRASLSLTYSSTRIFPRRSRNSRKRSKRRRVFTAVKWYYIVQKRALVFGSTIERIDQSIDQLINQSRDSLSKALFTENGIVTIVNGNYPID